MKKMILRIEYLLLFTILYGGVISEDIVYHDQNALSPKVNNILKKYGIPLKVFEDNKRVYSKCNEKYFCMSCHPLLDNVCTLCFNYNFSRNTARALDRKKLTCTTMLPKALAISNCEYYNPNLVDWYVMRYLDTCSVCKSRLLEYDAYLRISYCVDNRTTGPSSYCKQIDNCLQTVCFKSRNPGTEITNTWTNQKNGIDFTKSTVGCRICKNGYHGINYDTVWDTGSGSCIKEEDYNGVKIENCLMSIQVTNDTYKCYMCQKGYAVVKEIYVTKFVNDSNVIYMNVEEFTSKGNILQKYFDPEFIALQPKHTLNACEEIDIPHCLDMYINFHYSETKGTAIVRKCLTCQDGYIFSQSICIKSSNLIKNFLVFGVLQLLLVF